MRRTSVRLKALDLYAICNNIKPDEKIKRGEEYVIDPRLFRMLLEKRTGRTYAVSEDNSIDVDIDSVLLDNPDSIKIE